MALTWQPLFGGGFRISWGETLDLTPEEAERMIDTATEWGQRERKALSGGKQ